MKRFHELTKQQQSVAIEHAKKTVGELIEQRVVTPDRTVTDTHMDEFAIGMCEDAWYSERTDHIVADIADGK